MSFVSLAARFLEQRIVGRVLTCLAAGISVLAVSLVALQPDNPHRRKDIGRRMRGSPHTFRDAHPPNHWYLSNASHAEGPHADIASSETYNQRKSDCETSRTVLPANLLSPPNHQTYHVLAATWHRSDGTVSRGASRTPKAGEPLLQEVTQANPTNTSEHNDLGALLAEHGRLSDAQYHFIQALRYAPAEPTARCNLGISLLVQGKSFAAVIQFREAVTTAPHSAWAHLLLGTALGDTGELDESATHLAEALKFLPDNPDVHFQLGLNHQRRGEWEDAAEHFSDAIRLDDNHIPSLLALTWLRILSEDPQRESIGPALELAERIRKVTQDPEPDMLNVVTGIYAAVGRKSDALDVSTQALTLADSEGQSELAAFLRARLFDQQQTGDTESHPSLPVGFQQSD
jgi:Flp pilus assembly protein TadD